MSRQTLFCSRFARLLFFGGLSKQTLGSNNYRILLTHSLFDSLVLWPKWAHPKFSTGSGHLQYTTGVSGWQWLKRRVPGEQPPLTTAPDTGFEPRFRHRSDYVMGSATTISEKREREGKEGWCDCAAWSGALSQPKGSSTAHPSPEEGTPATRGTSDDLILLQGRPASKRKQKLLTVLGSRLKRAVPEICKLKVPGPRTPGDACAAPRRSGAGGARP